MAYPFLTPKPIIGRPISGGVSMALTTDPAHATAVGLRLRLYTNEARTVATGSGGGTTSSGGSVKEQLVCEITSLPADTRVYPKMEYEEVAGSGTWVEIAAVSADPGFYTRPAASGTAKIVFSTDEHVTVDEVATPENSRYIRQANAATAIAAQKFHLHVGLGDHNVDLTPAAPDPAQFADQDECDQYGIDFRALNDDAFSAGPYAFVNGNHEEDDGSGTGMAALIESMHNNFFLNPVDEDADGRMWKIDMGPVLLLGFEPYTESGFANFSDPPAGDVTDPEDWDIPAAAKTMIADELAATTCPFVLLCPHQILGGATAYGSGGGEKIDIFGTYMHTLLGVIRTARAANANIKQVVIFYGHDHAGHHAVVGDVHVCQVPSTTTKFSARVTAAMGYLNAAGGPATNSSFANDEFNGIVRVSVSPTSCTIEWVRTTAADDATAADEVVHTLTIAAAGGRGALRPAGLRRGRAA